MCLMAFCPAAEAAGQFCVSPMKRGDALMKQIYPSYYTAFRCIGGACGDNCCIGWEIEIDSKTLAAYREEVYPDQEG